MLKVEIHILAQEYIFLVFVFLLWFFWLFLLLVHCNNTWGRQVWTGFSHRVWRDPPRGHPKGAEGPEGCPRGWSRHTRSENPISTSSEHGQKYRHYFMHLKGWLHQYETPHWTICINGKVIPHTLTLHSFHQFLQMHWKSDLHSARQEEQP